MRPRRRLAAILAGLALPVLSAAPAAAQGPPGGGGLVEVSLETPTIAFPTPGVADFDTGWIDHPGAVVAVRARPPQTAWELRIRADAASMGGYGKPVEDVLWRTSTSTVWTPLSTTDQVVLQGQGDTDVTVLFRMRLHWALDVPGTYGSGIALSLVRL